MRRAITTFGLAAAALLAGCSTIEDRQDAAVACPGNARSTQQAITLGSGLLDYTACAGTLTIQGEDGEAQAELFYTAYFGQRGDTPRPLAFVWNGGPGADSSLLHFHALGPRVFRDGLLADNPHTPLPVADLVFLDPAGTGFSRPASEEAADDLYSTTGDIAATTKFIATFMNEAGREAAPLHLVGESFGTWRATGAAERLIDEGIAVAGLILVSGGIPLGDQSADERALMRALSLPNRTATAIALYRLPADRMEEAEQWALETWYPALKSPDELSPSARDGVVAGLERYTGVPTAAIDSETLWMAPRDFRTTLLAEQGKTLGIFDMRETTAPGDDTAEGERILRYYRETLGWTDGEYSGVERDPIEVGRAWQYNQAPITEESLARAMAGEGPPSPSQPWTRRVLEKAPGLRILVTTGLYDSLNSCAANERTVAGLRENHGPRISHRCYRGGHMMYAEPSEAPLFGSDVSDFLTGSLKSQDEE